MCISCKVLPRPSCSTNQNFTSEFMIQVSIPAPGSLHVVSELFCLVGYGVVHVFFLPCVCVLCAGTRQGRRGSRPSRQPTTEEPWWAQAAWHHWPFVFAPYLFLWLLKASVFGSGHHPGVRHHRREVLRKHSELDEEHKRGEAVSLDRDRNQSGKTLMWVWVICVLVLRFGLFRTNWGCN